MTVDVKILVASLVLTTALSVSATLALTRYTSPATPQTSCNQAIRDVEHGVLQLVPSKDASRPM